MAGSSLPEETVTAWVFTEPLSLWMLCGLVVVVFGLLLGVAMFFAGDDTHMDWDKEDRDERNRRDS